MVEIYCNRKGGIVSEKHREVELDDGVIRAICTLLIKQYSGFKKARGGIAG